MKNLFKSKIKKSKLETMLDEALYTFPKTKDTWTVADACQGAIAFGATGTGKSSGICAPLLYSALKKKNTGGIIPVVKSDHFSFVMRIIKAAGREKDVVHFHPGSGLSFNPIEYELNNPREGFGQVVNIVNMLTTIIEIGEFNKSGGQGHSEEKFWTNEVERLCNRMISLLQIAGEPVTIKNMRRILIDAFTEEDVHRYRKIWSELKDENLSEKEKDAVWEEYQNWSENNYFLYAFNKANMADLSEDQRETLLLISDYFFKFRPRVSSKTTAIVNATFLGGLAEHWLDGILRNNFSSGVSDELRLENTFEEGKIIIVDFPIKKWGIAGVMANAIMKLAWQRVMETRDVEKEEDPRPAFLYADEYQCLCAPQYDSKFQGTARSALAITIYATQNLSGLVAAMGSHMALDKAKSLTGNLATKFFCANDNYDTNKLASDMIGMHIANLQNLSVKEGGKGSLSFNQRLMPKINTDQLTMLRTGRSANNYMVDAVVFKAGKQWKNGQNYLVAEFDQNFYKN